MINFDIKEFAKDIRLDIKGIAKQVKLAKSESFNAKSNDYSEVMANLTLAYRHLEDARMRMGKVLEAHEGFNKFDVAATKEALEEDTEVEKTELQK